MLEEKRDTWNVTFELIVICNFCCATEKERTVTNKRCFLLMALA